MSTPTFAMPNPNMVVNTVDDADEVLGTIVRKAVLPTGHNFRVAHLLLTNTRGDVLLQQLAMSRERHPGAWGASVACYLFAGESYEEAIQRRVVQELGCVPSEIRFLLKTRMIDEDSTKFVGVFAGRAEGPFVIDTAHIARVEFFSPSQIAAELMSGGRIFTPTFRHIYGETSRLQE